MYERNKGREGKESEASSAQRYIIDAMLHLGSQLNPNEVLTETIQTKASIRSAVVEGIVMPQRTTILSLTGAIFVDDS